LEGVREMLGRLSFEVERTGTSKVEIDTHGCPLEKVVKTKMGEEGK